MRKIIFSLVVFAIFCILGAWCYVTAKTLLDFESLLLCSEGKDESVPKSLCQSYLFKFGGKPNEIAVLNRGIGIGWVMRAENKNDRDILVEFLLKKGVDINAIDQRSGITALHTSVLENDLPTVDFLLSNHANPSVKDRDSGKTPLDFALERKNKSGQPDRSAIIRRLEIATENIK